MIEGVRLWYATEDNTKLQNATAKDIFIPFMKKKDLKGGTAEDVFRRHSGFLIEQMKKELGKWSKKPLYQYLRKLQKELQTETTPQPQTTSKTPAMAATQRETKKRGRPPKIDALEQPKTPQNKKKVSRTPIDDLYRIETEGAVLWKFVQLKSERYIRADKLDIDKLASMLHNEFLFDDEKQAANYIRFQGKNLLKAMQDRRQQRMWGTTPLHRELMDTILTQNMIGKMAKIVLQPRDYTVGDELYNGLDIYASSDEEVLPHHKKSALRPKSGGKGKSYTANQDRDDENISSGSMTPKKRKGGIEESLQRRSKRRALSVSQTSDRSSTKGDLDNGNDTNDSEAQTADKTLPLRWKDSKAKPDPSEEIPVVLKGATLKTEPNAPGDVWHCTVLGCMQTIYSASSNLGKRLIDNHIYEHLNLEERPPQLNIIMNETKKTNLPVR
jgi:hypothetical protein